MHGSTGAPGIMRGALASSETAGAVGAAMPLAAWSATTSRRSNMVALPTRFLTCSPTAGSAIFQCPVPRSGKLGGTT